MGYSYNDEPHAHTQNEQTTKLARVRTHHSLHSTRLDWDLNV